MSHSDIAMPSCDISANPDELVPEERISDFLFGRFPNLAPQTPAGRQVSAFFPVNMSTDSLYPEESSIWTDQDGVKHVMACFVPNAEVEVVEYACPDPFVAAVLAVSLFFRLPSIFDE